MSRISGCGARYILLVCIIIAIFIILVILFIALVGLSKDDISRFILEREIYSKKDIYYENFALFINIIKDDLAQSDKLVFFEEKAVNISVYYDCIRFNTSIIYLSSLHVNEVEKILSTSVRKQGLNEIRGREVYGRDFSNRTTEVHLKPIEYIDNMNKYEISFYYEEPYRYACTG